MKRPGMNPRAVGGPQDTFLKADPHAGRPRFPPTAIMLLQAATVRLFMLRQVGDNLATANLPTKGRASTEALPGVVPLLRL
jgi:hypothetical protein